MGTAVLIGLVVLLGAWAALHNGLVRRRNRVEQAYATIDVQLVQRWDLIPKLVETVRQYITHERGLLEDIVRLRNTAVSSRTPDERMKADSALSAALGQLRVTVESYPDLRSSENFLQLQQSLNEVEEQIAAARRAYNSAVTDYNDAVQTFPGSIVAGLSGFGVRQVYVAAEQKRADVDMRQLFTS